MNKQFQSGNYRSTMRLVGWFSLCVGTVAVTVSMNRLNAEDRKILAPPTEIQMTASDIPEPPKPVIIPASPSLNPSTILRRKSRSFIRQLRPDSAPSGGLNGHAVQLTGDLEFPEHGRLDVKIVK